MSTEVLIDNKENLINKLSTTNFCDRRTTELLAKELGAIAAGQANSDILEITPWDKISMLTGAISNINNFQFSKDFSVGVNYTEVGDQYELFRKHCLSSFLVSAIDCLNTIDGTSRLRNLLQDEKKVLGSAHTLGELSSICDILTKSNQSGAIPKTQQIILQFPGTFYPFPHDGHLEVVQTVMAVGNGGQEIRVLVSTFAKNFHRSEGVSIPFMYKLDMLRRGFAYEKQVTVFGVEGDTSRQKMQMEVISQLSSDKKINYVCGSDVIIKKVEEAITGNKDALDLIFSNLVFYVSVRKLEDQGRFDLALSYLKKLGITTVILKKPILGLSGTSIRNRIFEGGSPGLYVNNFVNEKFEKDPSIALSYLLT